MSTSFRCDDKETLVAYLYGDIDPPLHREIRAHLRVCDACAEEVDALEDVRRDLAAWQPPEAQLNFAIASKAATVLRPERWSGAAVPRWLQVAAAIVLLAGGAAIANVQVRYDDTGVTVSTGWMNQSAAPAPVVASGLSTSPVQPVADWRPALTALEADLRHELQLVRSTQEAAAPRSASSTVDGDVLLRRVQALVAESERRQQQELAVRMAQFGRDVQTDLYRINQGFRQLQGRTGVVEGNQREIVNFVNQVRRVSTQQVP